MFKSVRLARYWRYWSTRPRYVWYKYPEGCVAAGVMFLVGTQVMWNSYNDVYMSDEQRRSYYGEHFTVYRLESPEALKIRPPEDYPPRWLTRRKDNYVYWSVKGDYE